MCWHESGIEGFHNIRSEMTVTATFKVVISPKFRLRFVHEPSICVLVDFLEIRHMLFEIRRGSGARSLLKKLDQFGVVMAQFQVALKVLEAISMRCKGKYIFNPFKESFLAI